MIYEIRSVAILVWTTLSTKAREQFDVIKLFVEGEKRKEKERECNDACTINQPWILSFIKGFVTRAD